MFSDEKKSKVRSNISHRSNPFTLTLKYYDVVCVPIAELTTVAVIIHAMPDNGDWTARGEDAFNYVHLKCSHFSRFIFPSIYSFGAELLFSSRSHSLNVNNRVPAVQNNRLRK